MAINLQLLQQEFDTAGITNVWADVNGGLTWDDTATQQQKDQAAALVLAHVATQQTEPQKGRSALVTILNNNADLLKYADYFFSRSTALSAQQIPPRDTNLTTLTTATITLMQGNRGSDVTHNSMWRLFLWELRMKYALFNTEDELPGSLTAVQARQVLIEAKDFIDWGVLRCHMLLLRNLI